MANTVPHLGGRPRGLTSCSSVVSRGERNGSRMLQSRRAAAMLSTARHLVVLPCDNGENKSSNTGVDRGQLES